MAKGLFLGKLGERLTVERVDPAPELDAIREALGSHDSLESINGVLLCLSRSSSIQRQIGRVMQH